MKKNIIKISIFTLLALTIFAGCEKVNVKNGNNKIVGTWTLTSSEGKLFYDETEKESYLPANNCAENYTYSEGYFSTLNYSGSSITELMYEYDRTQVGTSLDSLIYDTTFTYKYTKEITFNEDGTCKMIIYNENLYGEYADKYNETQEITGFWNWEDASLDKIGISITFHDYQIFWYINEMSKKTMDITSNIDYTETNTLNSTDICDNVTIAISNTYVYKSSNKTNEVYTKK